MWLYGTHKSVKKRLTFFFILTWLRRKEALALLPPSPRLRLWIPLLDISKNNSDFISNIFTSFTVFSYHEKAKPFLAAILPPKFFWIVCILLPFLTYASPPSKYFCPAMVCFLVAALILDLLYINLSFKL